MAVSRTHAASTVGGCCAAGGQGRGHHERHACRAAEDVLGLLPPGGSLLGQGAWFVLGVAGLQGGLLGEQDRLHHRRRAAVVALERGRQLAAAGLDRRAPGRPAPVQGRVDTDHLTDRALAPLGAGTLREDQPEPGAQVLLQGGVVGLGGGDLGLEQDPPVDRQPLPGQGLDLVRHRDVGVQVRVPGAGVAVGERGRDQAGDVDLADPVGALPGVQGVLLDERQGVGDGLVVGQLDLRRDLRWGDRPQGADRLHRGEGQVVPAHRRGLRAGTVSRSSRTARGRRAGPDRAPHGTSRRRPGSGSAPGPRRRSGSRVGAPGRRRGPRSAWRPRPGTRSPPPCTP